MTPRSETEGYCEILSRRHRRGRNKGDHEDKNTSDGRIKAVRMEVTCITYLGKIIITFLYILDGQHALVNWNTLYMILTDSGAMTWILQGACRVNVFKKYGAFSGQAV
jgi:hypothetical protein